MGYVALSRSLALSLWVEKWRLPPPRNSPPRRRASSWFCFSVLYLDIGCAGLGTGDAFMGWRQVLGWSMRLLEQGRGYTDFFRVTFERLLSFWVGCRGVRNVGCRRRIWISRNSVRFEYILDV